MLSDDHGDSSMTPWTDTEHTHCSTKSNMLSDGYGDSSIIPWTDMEHTHCST